jgi:hypothetical protein
VHLGVIQNGQKQHYKPVFWLFWTISPKRMDLIIWLGAHFMLRHCAIHPAYLQAFVYLLWSI